MLKEQSKNPNGLHRRFILEKADGTPIDPRAEYFVLRLDKHGKDINHIKACRIGIHAYADAIEPYIPQLADDLRKRYPLIP